MQQAIEHTVDDCPDCLSPNRFAKSTASLIATRPGVSPNRISLAGQPQHIAIDSRMRRKDIGRLVAQLLVNIAPILTHAAQQPIGKLDQWSIAFERETRNCSEFFKLRSGLRSSS